jgi:hypothetical protein
VHFFDFAEVAVQYSLYTFAAGDHVPLLAPGLGDAPVLPDRAHHLPAFIDGEGQRLLAVDILAGAARVDYRFRVPVIRRRDHHRINIGRGQKFAVIIVERRTGKALSHFFEAGAVHVAQRHELPLFRQAVEAVGAPAAADVAHAYGAISGKSAGRRGHTGRAKGGRGGECQRRAGLLEESPAWDGY